jgi:hypothetical protein
MGEWVRGVANARQRGSTRDCVETRIQKRTNSHDKEETQKENEIDTSCVPKETTAVSGQFQSLPTEAKRCAIPADGKTKTVGGAEGSALGTMYILGATAPPGPTPIPMGRAMFMGMFMGMCMGICIPCMGIGG